MNTEIVYLYFQFHRRHLIQLSAQVNCDLEFFAVYLLLECVTQQECIDSYFHEILPFDSIHFFVSFIESGSFAATIVEPVRYEYVEEAKELKDILREGRFVVVKLSTSRIVGFGLL